MARGSHRAFLELAESTLSPSADPTLTKQLTNEQIQKQASEALSDALSITDEAERARQIRAGLLAELDRIGARQADFDILELGYGDLAPVGCGDDAVGGVSNRRVEVWVRERI